MIAGMLEGLAAGHKPRFPYSSTAHRRSSYTMISRPRGPRGRRRSEARGPVPVSIMAEKRAVTCLYVLDANQTHWSR
jgi:hypothetical protein